jgi:hypothetical protein
MKRSRWRCRRAPGPAERAAPRVRPRPDPHGSSALGS